MSTAPLKYLSDAFPAKVMELLVESLRRDAFVMEAFNYQEPAVAESPEFLAIFELLYRQVAALYSDSVYLVLAIDAQGCRKRNSSERERKIITGAGVPTEGCRVWQCTSALAIPNLPRLSQCLSCAADIIKFCSTATPAFSVFFQRAPNEQNRIAILAPYLVRSVDKSFTGATYQEIIKSWAEASGKPQLMHTRPYAGGVVDRIFEFENAYFSAALLIRVGPEFLLDDTRMNCLEALHLSFQISWGLPALEEQKRESAMLVQDQQELRRRYESIQQIQALARSVSRQVQDKLNDLVRQLDPGTGLDHEDIAELFDPESDGRPKQIWRGQDVTIHQLHSYRTDRRREVEALIHFAIHRTFDKVPDTNLTLAELTEASKRLVEGSECSTTARRFYDAILTGDKDAFNLLKAIVHPFHRPREISLYAFAIRLFLNAIAGEELTVHIYENAACGPCTTLDARTFLSAEIRQRLLQRPTFVVIADRPPQWAFPLSKLIGEELSGVLEKQKVYVRSVDLIRYADSCCVVCPLICAGSPEELTKVKAVLEAEPRDDWSSLREVVSRLVDIRRTIGNEFDWSVTADNELIFTIGRSR